MPQFVPEEVVEVVDVLGSRNDYSETIQKKTKKEFEAMVNEWKEEKTPQSKGRMEQGKAYLLSNWTAAKTRLLRQDGVEGK